ncbi:Uncharacterised protein [Vibrio cholerae]|uniref:Uncharacterized protein n=1 Tax=Vibrio cholerae TaxID=666 RepID=A0A655URF4_VIBCL|nr:Uncharacterised protein [Vibrio cholerae]
MLPILLSSGGTVQTSLSISKWDRRANRSSDSLLPHNIVIKCRFLIDVPALLRSRAIQILANSGSVSTLSPSFAASPTSCCRIFSKCVPSIRNFDLQKFKQARIFEKAEFAILGFLRAMSSNHIIHSRAVIFSTSTSWNAG